MHESRRDQTDGERRRKNRRTLSCSLFACLPSTKIPSFVHRTRSLPPRADVTSISPESYRSNSNERYRTDGHKFHRIKTITWPIRGQPTEPPPSDQTNAIDDETNGKNNRENAIVQPDSISTVPESSTGSTPTMGRTRDRRSKRTGHKSSKSSKRHVTIANGNGQQADGGQSFLRAARSGNLSKVIELLNSGVDLDTTNAVSDAVGCVTSNGCIDFYYMHSMTNKLVSVYGSGTQ